MDCLLNVYIMHLENLHCPTLKKWFVIVYLDYCFLLCLSEYLKTYKC